MNKTLKLLMWGVAIILMALAVFLLIAALLPPEMIKDIV